MEGISHVQTIYGSDGTRNLLADVNGIGPRILVAAHYDVVPAGTGWTYNPFEANVEGDKVFGRGSADDKGGVAVALALLGASNGRWNLTVALTGDEEVGGENGLNAVIGKTGKAYDIAIILDSFSKEVHCGASGVVSGKIIVKGRGGHAGYPYLSDNPIYKLPEVISRLKKFSELREEKLSALKAPAGSPKVKVWGRFTPTVIEAGDRTNVIPNEAVIKFDMRLLPDEDRDAAFEELKSFIGSLSAVELAEVKGGGNYFTDPRTPIVSAFTSYILERLDSKECVGELGGDDGKYSSKAGIPTVGYGVIDDDSNIHGANEFVRLSTMMKVTENMAGALDKLAALNF
ncbi:MAG: M20/M25/M40 family metallo-hydrolase [Thaumarchaeota archaeon]|nr:M20/M25/M40 family metallo-hydrolase [Nitrososphaerota archaeon]